MPENENSRLKRGQAKLQEVDAEAATNVMLGLADVAPDIATYIEEFAFGDIYSRSGLDLKQREMITVTSLLTQGDTAAQLEVHINGCLNVGLTKQEVVESFIQCLPYVGFPKVLNAVAVAKRVFASRK
ncbi:MAG: carboxymuconolactone decarboxylase family protein [Furfurilactobacillus sp.]|jgi:4-carboxymuconolactone decarboxylase|uniref:Carboxymuconolactone decarboxylase family protein n=1 Tax=Furfurilactobacillus milii TaxID=2888272 RepID=A0ABT6DBP3_9LACO|nr:MULTISPECIES: carboxymuconolactone decarboxylase family protein [Furfurilactobacillus]QLE67641.1 4-carboxymuconolactone decarboxylase [Furfurilactobacillus rossiae]MCF6160509.1 carboxymuconolactone decarboxylase family protein [Furfurilactobacillus milii]MCF6162741.1 carboxymuconolactone decarboxylase family protein [Furfurilactobacillus milii]MCF6418250.1 carboxymuconolactone decarboxylase family protein [Furfurilactobacillus milii]MCH4011771.1 carboxymuconolactone decarboxylase family pro